MTLTVVSLLIYLSFSTPIDSAVRFYLNLSLNKLYSIKLDYFSLTQCNKFVQELMFFIQTNMMFDHIEQSLSYMIVSFQIVKVIFWY